MCKKPVKISKVKFMNLRIAWDDIIMMFGSMNSSLWLVLGSYISKLILYHHPKHLQHIFTDFFSFFFLRRVTAIYIKYLRFAWISEWIIKRSLFLRPICFTFRSWRVLWLHSLGQRIMWLWQQQWPQENPKRLTALSRIPCQLDDGCAIILYLVWKCGCQRPWTS